MQRRIVIAQSFGEILKLFFLLRIQLSRHSNLHVDVEVPFSICSKLFQTLAAEAEGCSILGACRDFDIGFAIKSRHRQITAEGSDWVTQRNVAMQILAFSLEDIVLFDLNDNVEIAIRTTACSSIAVSAGTEAGTFFNPSWHFQADACAIFHAATAVALLTRIGDGLAGAITVRTGLLDLEEATGGNDLAYAATGATRFSAATAL